MTNTYGTKFGESNAITYPQFMFDYPDNWMITQEDVTQEDVTQEGESVTLTNDSGVEITYLYICGVAEGTTLGLVKYQTTKRRLNI